MTQAAQHTAPARPWAHGARALAWAAAVAAALALLLLLGLLLASALYLALNRQPVQQAQPTTIVHAWHQPAATPRQARTRAWASGIAAVTVLVLLPALLASALRPRRPLHGAARFATRAEVARAGLLLRPGHAAGPAILVGRLGPHYLALPGQLSVMLSAPTRSGKGVGVVIPNLLHWPDSVVVLDIKGENHAITAGFRARHGHAVYAFAPFDDVARSHRWNPLSTVRTSPMHRVADLLSIGQVFFPNDGTGTSSEAFFNDQARNLFLGLGLLLLESPALPRTLGEMLRQSSGKGQPLKEHLAALITQRREAGQPFSDECHDALQRLLANSENTLSSIVATFNAPLTLFADAVVDAATSADDFHLADVRRRRMAVYVCVPPHRLAAARPLLNLFFSQLVSLNTRHLPQPGGADTLQCLLVNDEFTAMGRVGVVAQSAAYLAGYGLRLLTVVQAMSQLDTVYGDKEARTFATNHGLQVLFAPREQRYAEEYSAMLGHFTERATSRGRSRSTGGHGHGNVSHTHSDQRRALLLPQEFKELGRERLVVLAEDCKPILGHKLRYHQDPVLRQRLLPPPEVPALDMGLHLARVHNRWHEVTEWPEGDPFNVEALAHELHLLPDSFEGAPADIATALLGVFGAGPAPAGGHLEPLPDEDGVLPEPAAAVA